MRRGSGGIPSSNRRFKDTANVGNSKVVSVHFAIWKDNFVEPIGSGGCNAIVFGRGTSTIDDTAIVEFDPPHHVKWQDGGGL